MKLRDVIKLLTLCIWVVTIPCIQVYIYNQSAIFTCRGTEAYAA